MKFKQFFTLVIEKGKKAISRLGNSNAEALNANDNLENMSSDTPGQIPFPQVEQPATANASEIAGSVRAIRATITQLDSRLGQVETQIRATQFRTAPPPIVVSSPESAPPINTSNTSPWKLPPAQAAFLLLFALAVGIILFLRLFQLDTFQNEIYGDIDIVRDFVSQVLAGGWPIHFILSAGPLYGYLIAPVIFLTGLNYAGIKLASAIVSLGVLAATYAFSRRLVNDYFALLVMFIAGVSSWLLVFSRLGNLLILLPLVSMLALWLVIRVIQYGRRRDVVACALVSALGLFVYPQSFILPGVIFVTLLCLGWAGKPLPRRWAGIFILVSIPCLLIFGYLVISDMSNFNGYVGNKILPGEGNNLFSVLGGNILHAMLAFHVRGDGVFRSNPDSLPHLDWISGILFLVGIVFWLINKERRSWVAVWLVPFFLLQVPSMLVLSQPGEVPSASRTVGVAPIVYMLVASGIWWLAQMMYVRGKRWRWPTILVTGLLLAGILFLNAQRYFQTYLDGLPYHDTPIGQLIGAYTDSLSADTQVYMVGCCWESGVPDYFVKFATTRPDNLQYVKPEDLSCSQLQSTTLPAVYIWSFHDNLPAPQLEGCKQWLPAQVYYYQGRPVFNAAVLPTSLRPGLGLSSTSSQPRPGEVQSSEGLERIQLQLDGQAVGVEYSPIDIGRIEDVFDGNTDTLMRGQSANPMVVVLHFSQPREINTVAVNLGTMANFHVTVAIIYADDSSKSTENDYQNLPDDPHIEISLPEYSQLVTSLRLMVQNMNAAEADGVYHIHIREIQLH